MRPEEVWGLEEKAHRVLQAEQRPSKLMVDRELMLPTQEGVMPRADITDIEEFLAIAQYLQKRGWITDESDVDYGVFVLSVEGLDEAMHY